jgi:hypothetical protein
METYAHPPALPFGAPHTYIPASDQSHMRRLLASARAQLADLEVAPAMDRLVNGLADLRRELAPDDWKRVVREECRTHPVFEQLHNAPVTRRAFARPRGYPGDAETLDLVYGCGRLSEPMNALGAALYGYELQMSAAQSVRVRREILAALIDEVCLENPDARVLSIACGHLREAERSAAVRTGSFGAFYALDQDQESLSLVDRAHSARGVTTVRSSVKSILTGSTRLESLDLVYAAGLYDYLEAPVAAKLTARMFSMLGPRGRLLVANFATTLRDAAFMDAFMDWPLIYRTEKEVEHFADEVAPEHIAMRRLYRDAPGNVIYLELRRV